MVCLGPLFTTQGDLGGAPGPDPSRGWPRPLPGAQVRPLAWAALQPRDQNPSAAAPPPATSTPAQTAAAASKLPCTGALL